MFDTVLIATGRYPDVKSLNLLEVGVNTAESGKIIVDKYYKTSVESVRAIGDVIVGAPELTPVAIREG
jgi:pyruvate/2-oxoglutarate dehydrogenase complex dihydrolipoamide dehydrogenase (E3) component